jgi:SAM-dependent methyltransferase
MDLSDVEFDRIYPSWARELSATHWTPIEVARRAAELLAVRADARILDVGAGVGKVCVVGALTTTATFVGIEQRKELVDVAREVAERSGAERAQFIHGNMTELDWNEFDGIYLFNPFYEHIAEVLAPIGAAIELSPDLYVKYITTTFLKLLSTRIGTRVATYNGFGASMPAGFRLISHEPFGNHFLNVWEKESLK